MQFLINRSCQIFCPKQPRHKFSAPTAVALVTLAPATPSRPARLNVKTSVREYCSCVAAGGLFSLQAISVLTFVTQQSKSPDNLMVNRGLAKIKRSNGAVATPASGILFVAFNTV